MVCNVLCERPATVGYRHCGYFVGLKILSNVQNRVTILVGQLIKD